MKKLFFLATVFFAVGCAVSKNADSTSGLTKDDVKRVQDLYADVTLEELNKGMNLYEANCDACHKLKDPKSEGIKGWNHHVPEMVELSNEKKGTKLTKSDEQAILRYLVSMNRK